MHGAYIENYCLIWILITHHFVCVDSITTPKSFFCHLQCDKHVSKNTMNITVTIFVEGKYRSYFTNNVFLKKRSKFLDCFCHDNFCKIYHNDKKLDIFHNTKISTLIHVSVFVVHEIKKNCWLFKQPAFTFYSNQWYVVVSSHATPGNTQWFVQNSIPPLTFIWRQQARQKHTWTMRMQKS